MKPNESSMNTAPRYFDVESYALLQTVIARLIPQSEAIQRGIALSIDAKLETRTTATQLEAGTYSKALHQLNASAKSSFGMPFMALSGARQEELLHAAIDFDPQTESNADEPMQWVFEELLSEAVAVFYSHPQNLEDGKVKPPLS